MNSIEEDIRGDVINGQQEEKSELAKVVETLLNDKWGRRKTRIDKYITTPLTTMDTIAQIYDVSFLKTWITGYTEYVTSVGGKGREEIVDITKYTIDKEAKRDKQMMEMMGRR